MIRQYTNFFANKVMAIFGLLFTFSIGLIPIVVVIQFMIGQIDDVKLILTTSVCLPMPIIGMSIYSRYADIQLFEEGLRVQILPFWWKIVLWEEIIDVQAVLPFFHTYAVVVQNLTIFHRFLGVMYIAGVMHGFKPIFFISPTMEDRYELLAIIEQNID